ncbi:MAG: peptidylprolyl isomerase [Bacteroidales bacterium]|jgi:peptidyl-prolyl cis-trans isomerase B (cyclophilin B)|nr:peptidylprolyl isomerase [Bacteroidales bacterium]MCR5191148.1 peptidylprolyl isomerase [Bacteroidales bacterium]
MRNNIIFSILCGLLIGFSPAVQAQKGATEQKNGTQNERQIMVTIETNKGTLKVKLYNETPLHRDNFVKLAKEGYFDSLLFHRVIKDFMIQGGDPDSRHASPDQSLGMGGPDYTIPAEFNRNLIHKRGALAAARDNNPQKASSGSQFYIVQGKAWTDGQLDAICRQYGLNYTPQQRNLYRTIGGTPFLDMNYTVFGEVVEGLSVIDKIASVATNREDRPVEDVRILSVRVEE